MISKKSIYPCYSQFLILFTDLDEFEERRFIRLVRIFTLDRKEDESNPRKLSYLREYKLPYNNVLQLNCSSDFPLFPPSTIKYYCFQFVAKDKVTRIIHDKVHRPKCRPSLLSENDGSLLQRSFHVSNEVINQNIQNEVNKLQFQNRYDKKLFNYSHVPTFCLFSLFSLFLLFVSISDSERGYSVCPSSDVQGKIVSLHRIRAETDTLTVSFLFPISYRLDNLPSESKEKEKSNSWTRRTKNVNVNCECVQSGEEEEKTGENAIIPKSVMYDAEYPVILFHITFPSCPLVISSRHSHDRSHSGHESFAGELSNACVLTFVPDSNEEKGKGMNEVDWKKEKTITFDLQLLSVEEHIDSSYESQNEVAESSSILTQHQKEEHERKEDQEAKSINTTIASTRDILLSNLKFRDGSSRIDPLLPLVSDYSLINQVTSGNLRIERNTVSERFSSSSGLEVRMRLVGRYTNEQQRFMAVFTDQIVHQEQQSTSSTSLLRYYFMYGFGGFLVLASISFLLTCLTSSIRPHRVTINSRRGGEFEDEQKQLTSESHPLPNGSDAEGRCSLSQFDLEPDSNSLEMDYYDYHQCNLSTKNIPKEGDIETNNKTLSSSPFNQEGKRKDEGAKDEDEEGSIQNIDSD